VRELLDTNDVVRRLQLLTVRDALGERDGAASGGRDIAASASLREAVSAFLEGADRLRVRDGDATLGALAFADVRALLASER
jgi:hypothetical protein